MSRIEKFQNFLYSLFIEHPTSHNINYYEHFMRGLSLSFQTFLATFVLLIHSVFPKFFPGTGTSIILSINKQIEEFK